MDTSQRLRDALLQNDGQVRCCVLAESAFPTSGWFSRRSAARSCPMTRSPIWASSELSKIRRRIERQRQVVEESLEKFVRAHSVSGVLQDKYVTMRNGRTVVPVKAALKNRVDGIVHGASSTGQTVFVEPLDTIVQNNRLVRLREDEQGEILRILREMTVRLRSELELIVLAADAVGDLDYVFARARFWREFGCCRPRFRPGAEAGVMLEEARHPLLQDHLAQIQRRPVPLSLELGWRTADHDRQRSQTPAGRPWC